MNFNSHSSNFDPDPSNDKPLEMIQQVNIPNPLSESAPFEVHSNGCTLVKSSALGLNSMVCGSDTFSKVHFPGEDKYDVTKFTSFPEKDIQTNSLKSKSMFIGANLNSKIESFENIFQEEEKNMENDGYIGYHQVDRSSQEYLVHPARQIEPLIKPPNFYYSYWEDLSKDKKEDKEKRLRECEENFWSNLALCEKVDNDKNARNMFFETFEMFYEEIIKDWWPGRYQLFIKMAEFCDRIRCSEKFKLLEWAETDMERLELDKDTAVWLRILYFLQAKVYVGEDNKKSKRFLKNGYNIEQKYFKGKEDYLELYAEIKAMLCLAKGKKDKAKEWCKDAEALRKRRVRGEEIKWRFDWEIVEKELKVMKEEIL